MSRSGQRVRCGARGRLARFEPLEDRRLLSVSPLDVPAAAVLPRFGSTAALEDYLVADALTRYGDLFGKPADWWWLNWDVFVNGADALAGMAAGSSDGTTATGALPTDHSETNVQVPGVDEGDIVETDGDNLYVLSDHELVVLDSSPPEELAVVARQPLAGWPLAEYLQGDRLTVLSDLGGGWNVALDSALSILPDRPWSPQVRVTVFDVSDPAAPAIVQTTDLDGSLVSSRAIDSSVYVIVRNGFLLPGPELLPVDGEMPPKLPPVAPGDPGGSAAIDLAAGIPWQEGSQHYVYETRDEYLARIAGHVLDLALPQRTGAGADGVPLPAEFLTAATDIYVPDGPEDGNLMSVVVFDAVGGGPVASLGVPTENVSDVYVSPGSIYLMESQWRLAGTATEVYQIDFDPAGVPLALAATGRVPGDLLNQFSADEFDGYLRLATTVRSGVQTTTAVHVLQQEGTALAVTGKVEGLAPGEQVFSVRFAEHLGFVVTFERIDPLWVIDLSDPVAPAVVGELEIPGFSHYLHLLPDGYLVGIGRDADPQTGAPREPQVSLFDVSDPSTPRLLDRETIDVGPWGWSEAFSDHHAIGWYPDQRVLTFSVTSSGAWAETPDGWGEYLPPETSLYVFRIDPPAGVEPLGRITHDSPVRRSIRIADQLYAISADTVSVHPILHPDQETARLYYGNRMADLGIVAFASLDGVTLDPADPWYALEAGADGLLTVALPDGAGQVFLTLYDENLQPLAESASQRLDVTARAGQQFYLRVSPLAGVMASEEFSLHVANLVTQDAGRWTLHGTDDGDRFVLDAAAGTATVNGIAYPFAPGEVVEFILEGGAGDDSYALALADVSVQIVDTAGRDDLDFSAAAVGVRLDLNLSAGQPQPIGAGVVLQLTGVVEDATGTPLDDTIAGHAAGSRLSGGAGDDLLTGGDGEDWLYGDWGNDTIYGGAGIDRIFGQMGDDRLFGGPDRDVISGQGGQDQVDGEDGPDLLYGNGGHDRLLGRAGNDRLFGQQGSDVLVGGDGNDRLNGSLGRDVILAGRGIDAVMGHADEDLIVGGPTAYDGDQEALLALLAQWVQAVPLAQRIQAFTGGFGSGGLYNLALADAVLADGEPDSLAGNAGADWYLADVADLIVTGGGDKFTLIA